MVLYVLLFSFVSFLLLCQNGVVGDIWKLSKEEDLELERQLKLLNKPAIKTIHTEHGDIYDCIDFYKQPAFDHPLLKNHTFDIEMETVSNKTDDPKFSDFLLNFGLKGEQCPRGTVIIKRLSKEDLIREKIASKIRSGENGINIHYAGLMTKYGQRRYAGAACHIGVYNPHVDGTQYSAARIAIKNYLDGIEVGWRVDPYLFSERKTHFFIRTDVGAGGPTHCFNLHCPGFVITQRKLPIDSYFTKISQKGGKIYSIQVDITRDTFGNWRLRYGPYDVLEVGFWPANIFSPRGLKELAENVEWGGEVYSPQDYARKPPMGFGNFPVEDPQNSGFVSRLTYRNEKRQKLEASNLEPNADLDKVYKVIDSPDYNDHYRHTAFYGGPGE